MLGKGPILDGRDNIGEKGAGRLEEKVTALVPGLKGVEENREEVSGDGAQWSQLIFGMSSAAQECTSSSRGEGTNNTDYLLQRKADRERC
ncbi:hypothetical protein BY996DRAFT_6592150 [Phakopsora pachyrhizi]|nr:hypothetical protein BY996DRAFT_6592150 [Phakopsora pachyrhizi]